MSDDGGCMFDESGMVTAVEDSADRILEEINSLSEFVTDDLHLLMKSFSDQLEEQTGLLRLIVKTIEQS